MSFWSLLSSLAAERRLSLGLTLVAMTTSVVLLAGALHMRAEADEQLQAQSAVAPLVVGVGTSPSGLVLSAVFLLEDPTGIVPMQVLEELEAHPSTRVAVPIALGDSFHGRPVIATTEAFFDERSSAPNAIGTGRAFEQDAHEAVVGHRIAELLDLRVGDRIEPSHGGGHDDENDASAHEAEHLFEVVGVLAPAQGAYDDAVLIPLAAFLAMDEHQGATGVSAILLTPKAGMHQAILGSELRKRSDIVVADSATELQVLRGKLGSADGVLAVLAFVLSSATLLGVCATLWTATRGRIRELALLRFIGASRRLVATLVATEGLLLGAIAGLLGIASSKALLAIGAEAIGSATGLMPAPFVWRLQDAWLLVASAAVGGLASLPPAVEVYRASLIDLLKQDA